MQRQLWSAKVRGTSALWKHSQLQCFWLLSCTCATSLHGTETTCTRHEIWVQFWRELNCCADTSFTPHALYASLTLSWSFLECFSQTSPYVISGHIIQNLSVLPWKILSWWAAVELSFTSGNLDWGDKKGWWSLWHLRDGDLNVILWACSQCAIAEASCKPCGNKPFCTSCLGGITPLGEILQQTTLHSFLWWHKDVRLICLSTLGQAQWNLRAFTQ